MFSRRVKKERGAVIDILLKRCAAVCGSGALLAIALLATSASAEPSRGCSVAEAPGAQDAEVARGGGVQLCAGFAQLRQISAPVGMVIVGDGALVGISMVADDLIALTGLSQGSTNVILLSDDSRVLDMFDVVVLPAEGAPILPSTVLSSAPQNAGPIVAPDAPAIEQPQASPVLASPPVGERRSVTIFRGGAPEIFICQGICLPAALVESMR